MKKHTSLIIGLVGFVVLAALPFFGTVFAVSTVTQILYTSLLVVSVSILLGQGAMPTLGQAAYLGVGGYAAGLLAIHVTDDALLGLVVAAIAGLAVALITGPLVLRGKGGYLLMITLAIAQLLSQVANAWVSVTNGSDGLIGVPVQTLFGVPLDNVVYVHWFTLIVVAIVFFVLSRLLASPFGHSIRGIRDNETRMQALGYHTKSARLTLFCICGVVSAIGGALTITQTQYMAPSSMNFVASSIALTASIAGGSSKLWGAFLGSALITLTTVLMPAAWEGRSPLVLGVILILVVYLLPGGIAGAVTRWFGRGARRATSETAGGGEVETAVDPASSEPLPVHAGGSTAAVPTAAVPTERNSDVR